MAEAGATADWYVEGLEDDLRARMFAAARLEVPFALATIVRARGGPRPIGSQMVITGRQQWGFLSGGCIEADVARHGREVLDTGDARRLVYGTGSPFIDMPLPCGGRVEVLVERVSADDPALHALAALSAARQQVRWLSDGIERRCAPADTLLAPTGWNGADLVIDPPQRLIVVGWDAFALAIAEQGRLMGWAVTLLRPFGPDTPPPLDIEYSRAPVVEALATDRLDHWTAVAVATHDLDIDHDALVAALASDAGYVGLLGARLRLPERLARLRRAGVGARALTRLHAPIGLPLGAVNAREIALAVVAEIVAARREKRVARSAA